MTTREPRELDYFWTPPPSPSSSEWTGPEIGATNVVTRTKSRTPHHDKTLDKDPQARDALIGRAQSFADTQKTWTHDVVIHGIRVRATTNMPHLYDFWGDNWFSVDEWRKSSGREPPEEPQVLVYALGDVPGEEEAAYYSRQRNTIVFFNTSYYGQLKSWVLGAVGRILADQYGIHSIHGAAVSAGGKGILFIAPTGTGKSTASYGLMRIPDSLFHSDDWVYVRYALALKDGTRLAPVGLRLADGSTLRGYRILPWLTAHAPGPGDTVEGLTLDDEVRSCPAAEIDANAPLAAYAYISEKRFYLRTNIVESFPTVAPELLRSKLENCPDVSEAFLERHQEYLAHALRELDHHHAGSPEETRRDVARLMAFYNARAIMDIAGVFGAERVYSSPLAPMELSSVFLLRRDTEDTLVLRCLTERQFIAALLISKTPQDTYETAYNAYRAVDDAEERWFLEIARERASDGAGWEERLLPEVTRAPDAPVSLSEEFTLFRQLYRSAACFELNTILKADPAVESTPEAVELTLQLLERAASETPQKIDLHLTEYAGYLR